MPQRSEKAVLAGFTRPKVSKLPLTPRDIWAMKKPIGAKRERPRH